MPTTNITSHAVVLTAAERDTVYLRRAVESSLQHMDDEAVLEVPCSSHNRVDLANWCLTGGRTVLNPDDELANLFIQNTVRST